MLFDVNDNVEIAGRAPLIPASPLPTERSLEPVSTPGGTRTFSLAVLLARPSPGIRGKVFGPRTVAMAGGTDWRTVRSRVKSSPDRRAAGWQVTVSNPARRGAVAVVAGGEFAERDFLFHPRAASSSVISMS